MGGVRPRAADVRAQQLGRDQQARVPLVDQALERVDAVARPDPVRPLEDPEVDPRAARGAGLDLQARVPSPQLVEQPVQREGVLVDRCVPGPRISCARQLTVVVPLEIADRVLDEQRVEALEDVGVGPGVREVEHVLLTALGGQTPPGLEDPLRVGAREVRVEVDHLRLDPQTELHAETTDGVHERREPLRPDHRVDSPVAEPRGVVPASEEPAVVQHEALDADSGGALGQRQERREVVVEVDRLPRVERDRARPRRVRGPCPQLGVEARGQVVETVPPRPEDPRRAVGRTRGEVDLPRREEPRSPGATPRR